MTYNLLYVIIIIIRLPPYTGTLCFCAGSYATGGPATSAAAVEICSRNDFRTTFRISFIFYRIDEQDP